MNESKNIVLCADDFGLNPGISKGILKLAQLGRLSAVSCMVNSAYFVPYAQELRALQGKVQIGLHFNVTEGSFLSEPQRPCFTLNELLIKTHAHLVSLSFIQKEFASQLDQFVQVMQQLPDFIDGHQHVHQFPGIRQVILNLYQERLAEKTVLVRATYPAISCPSYQLKAKILALTGGKALKKQLKDRDIPHNAYFSGIYDFSRSTDYRTLFRKWLELAEENTLIMCHPGEGLYPEDVISHARNIELNYFLSPEFLEDLHAHSLDKV